ncbi:putative DNA binding domain-containing protein [Candidatus Desantisbacteria bacterium]|nr:putative DNA binding domain-containing protein [Candidatus Desantisbacteria bacterium]
MDKSKLLELISIGENERIEFKESLDIIDAGNRNIANEMAAFANTKGGYIIVGVNDAGRIVGVQDITHLEEKIMNIASDKLYPPIQLIFFNIKVEDKNVAVIEIPQGVNRPYEPAYIRRGSTKRKATREELRRLYQEGGLIEFDRTKISGSNLEDLDFDKIENYLQMITGKKFEDLEISKERLLENKEIAVYGESGYQVTVAGMLVFGKTPQRYLPQIGIKLVRFKGEDVGDDIIDRKEIEGDLPFMIDYSVSFIKRHTNLGAKIEGIKRIDVPEYLEAVIREAIINAVVHRDYSVRNANISMFIFDNRLEIRSPGRLPNSASLEKLSLGDHHPRNRLLFLFLETMGYGERIGTGIPRMIKRCKENAYPEPKFEEKGEEFWISLYPKIYSGRA